MENRYSIFFIFRMLILGIFCNALGQLKAQTAPTVIPPSPKTENFTRFGSYPVNPSSGAPDISIPLYTIKCGKLEVPITLRYHIGNVKPGDDHSDIGLGWILDVGGQITRTIYGKPDDVCPRPPTERSSSSLNDWNLTDLLYLRDCYENTYDTENDVFNYCFPSESGYFIMNKDANGIFKAETTPYKPTSFDFTLINSAITVTGKILNSIQAKDGVGNIYDFGGDTATEMCNSNGSLLAYTSFKLKRMADATQTDQIYFNYKKVPTYSVYNDVPDHFSISNYSILDLFNPSGLYPFITYLDHDSRAVDFGVQISNGPLAGFSYNELTLSKISFNSGRVIFDLSSDNKNVTGFTVYDKQNNVIKRIEFNKSLFGSYDHKKLDSLNIYDSQHAQSQVYRFNYNPGIMNSSWGHRGSDYWGYYNGQLEGATSRTYNFYDYGYDIPSPISFNPSSPGNKDPIGYEAQSEVLTKIIFPTKGETEFYYEGNKYSVSGDPNTQLNAGGLRLLKTVDRDGLGGEIQKTYQYEGGTIKFSNDDAIAYKKVSYTTIKQPILQDPTGYGYYIKQDNSYSNTIDGSLGDNRVQYAKVTETMGDTYNSNNIGKTIYYYQYNNDGYDLYTTGIGENDALYYIQDRRNWDSGLLYRKEILKKNDDGTFDVVTRENSNYSTDYNVSGYYTNLKIFHKVNFPGGTLYDQWIYRNQATNIFGQQAPPQVTLFDSRDYYITTCKIHLNSKVTTNYFKNQGVNNSIVTSTNYYYDNPLHDEVTRTVTTSSKGDVINENTWYPQDYSATPTNNLIGQHVLTVPIDQRTYVNGNLTSGKTTNYNSYGLPIGTYYAENELGAALGFSSTNPYSYGVLKEQFGYYSNRLSEYKITGNTTTTYIWGYNNTLPVAKVVNATLSEVETALGTWGYLPDLGGGGLSAAQNTALRSGLPNALVTTFTYAPLVGIVTQTDPKGMITYYEYDTFLRLKNIKDQNGNIVKSYDYHYKQ